MGTVAYTILITGLVALVPFEEGKVEGMKVVLVADVNHQPELRHDCLGDPLEKQAQCRIFPLSGTAELKSSSRTAPAALVVSNGFGEFLHPMADLNAGTALLSRLANPGTEGPAVAVIDVKFGELKERTDECLMYKYSKFLHKGQGPRALTDVVALTFMGPPDGVEISLGGGGRIKLKPGETTAIVNRPTLYHWNNAMAGSKKIKHFKRVFQLAGKGAWSVKVTDDCTLGTCDPQDCTTIQKNRSLVSVVSTGQTLQGGKEPASGTVKCPVSRFSGSG